MSSSLRVNTIVPSSGNNVAIGTAGGSVLFTVNSFDVTTSLIPPGAVQFFARNTAPDGWIKANGATISRSAYSALFAAVGTTFGAGDGSTTFTLPDMRGEFPRGWDDGRGVDSGRAFGAAQSDAIRNITGQVLDFTYNQSYSEPGGSTGAFAGTGNVALAAPTTTQQTGYPDKINFDASRQVPTASENRPRNIALLACIKY